MAKKRKRYVPRGSSGALSMSAKAAPKQDPYRYIRDGEKQQVAGRANLPTARQKDLASYVLPSQDSITAIRKGEAGAMDIADVALSLPGLAAVKPLVKGAKNMGVLKKVAEKGADLVGDASAYLKKSKGKGKTPDYESPPVSKTPQKPKTVVDDSTGKAVPYKPSKDPANKKASTPKPRTSAANIGRVAKGEQPRQQGQFSKPTAVEKVVGGAGRKIRENPVKAAAAAGAAGVGVGAGGMKLYDSIDPMPNNKKVDTAKAKKNEEPTVNKISGYELADDTNIRSPHRS